MSRARCFQKNKTMDEGAGINEIKRGGAEPQPPDK
jgi:hypothetical protein